MNHDQLNADWGATRDALTATYRRWLCRGESSIATSGLAVAIIILAVLVACAYFLSERGPMASAIPDLSLVGAASLLALWLVYRHFRTRMAAIGAIREALLDLQQGESSESALLIAADLGIEAQAWNRMVAEQQRLRRLAAVQETRSDAAGSTSSSSGSNSDLASGCDAMAHGLIMIDDQMHVQYANNAAALFLHKTRDQLIGQPIDPLLEGADLVDAMHKAVTASRRATHLVDRREQGEGVLRYIIRPVRRGDASTAMLVIEDVTQQRVAEEARHDFVAHATHELRTPLTNIRLYVETLLEGEAEDPTSRARCLDVINQETRRLERMVGDMLSVAEIEAGSLKIDRDDVKLDQLLHDVEQDYQALAQEKQIALEFHLPPKLPTLQADRDKLIMAIQNVVGNAMKYTPEAGSVTVSIESDDQMITLDVTETGIGIAPEDQEKVFEKFYRAADKRVSNITGSGLGLSLAREVVRLHGGDITLESQVDHGCTFTITLPVSHED